MKLYGLNNIVKCGSEIYFIDLVGERLHLRNEKPINLYGVTLDDIDIDLIEDIEMSDWVMDALFTRKYSHDNKEINEENWYWDLDSDFYKIKKDYIGLYHLMRGSINTHLMFFDTVRELQNAYHFYSDYEEVKLLNEDIDTKLKKLFKLI